MKKTIKVKGYVAVWKKEIMADYGIPLGKDGLPRRISEYFIIAESKDNSDNEYSQIDFPVFQFKKDADKFFNSKEWEIKKCEITVYL